MGESTGTENSGLKNGWISDFLKEKSSLISDSTGKIKHLVFQYNGLIDAYVDGGEIFKVYDSIIDSMDEDVKFTFMASREEDYNKLKDLAGQKKNPERFDVIKVDRDISVWTRDSMLPTKCGKDTVILLPNRNRDSYYLEKERAVAGMLKDKYPNFKTNTMEYIYVDGGDVLSGPAGIFVGERSINKTIMKLKDKSQIDSDFKFYLLKYYEQNTAKKVVEEKRQLNLNEVTFEEMLQELVPSILESKFQNKLYIIGKDDPETPEVEHQPVFHIDMCVTPIDAKTVLLADRKMAVDILGKLKSENLPEYERQIEEFARSACMSVGECKYWIERNVGIYGNGSNSDFEAAGKYLESQGFKVIRVPYLTAKVYMTYNNGLINNYYTDDGRHIKQVFLPVYGLKALDDEAVRIYKELGYEVIKLDFNDTAKMEGALRCISQVLEKSAA